MSGLLQGISNLRQIFRDIFSGGENISTTVPTVATLPPGVVWKHGGY